jgi:type IV secretion system protein VirD4
MLQLLIAGLAGWIWIANAAAFSAFVNANFPAAQGYGGAILAGLLIGVLCLLPLARALADGRGRSDGLWKSTIGRRLIGFAAIAALNLTVAATFAIAAYLVISNTLLAAAMGIAAAIPLRRHAKIGLGRGTRKLRWFLAGRHAGLGGSARWSGLLDEWANPWSPGMVLLGRSKYDPSWLVGIHDDRHVCTIATSRAGKGRSVVQPNLLTWPGSVICIDPKGENAAISALKRGHGGPGLSGCLGQTVRILDPLNEIENPALQTLRVKFNPIDMLDPGAPDYVERVRTIADALVVPGENKDTFFDNAARSLIAGVIDYVRMSPNVGNDERNLATVRGILIHPDGPPLDEMSEMGGLAQAGAAGMKGGGENSTKDVLFTAITHTDWLDSSGMQEALSASDFALKDLSDGNSTLYLVLPPHELDNHARFLRLFINLTLKAASQGRKGAHATLFLLDEVYSLGTLTLLSKSAGLLAGYGVKLWLILQNIGQLQELYPKNWETFLGNAGIWTVFAMNDATTAQYLSDRLGKRALWRKMRGPNGFEWELAGTASLRDPQELQKATSRRSETAAVFTESGEAFLLTRANYDQLFRDDEYSVNPLETGGR